MIKIKGNEEERSTADQGQNEAITMTAESYSMIEKLIENPPELNDAMKAAIERSKSGVIEIEGADKDRKGG